MNIYILILIIVAFISILALIIYSSIIKLKDYKERMDKANITIEENLEKKLNAIITINGDIKKSTDKDYLKDYINIKDLIMTNIEKDSRLNEASKLIYKLIMDNQKLGTSEKIKKQLNELRTIDEVLTSSKNIYNKCALLSNNALKTFPYNIVGKLFNYKIRSYYINNKTDDGDSF